MRSQFPDYGDFHCYDLGIDTILSQIAQSFIPIPTNHRGKRWGAAYLWENCQRSFYGSQKYRRERQNGDSKHETMFARLSEIPISDTFNELVEMDFVEYGICRFLQIRDIVSRSAPSFYGWKEKGGQTAEMARWKVVSNFL